MHIFLAVLLLVLAYFMMKKSGCGCGKMHYMNVDNTEGIQGSPI